MDLRTQRRAFAGSAAIKAASLYPAVGECATATALAYIDPSHEFTVSINRALTGLRLATVDSAGTRVPNELVRVNPRGCGEFVGQSGATMDLVSDSLGVVTLPLWRAPPAGNLCLIDVTLQRDPFPWLRFAVEVLNTAAPGVATYLVKYGEVSSSMIGTPVNGMAQMTYDGENLPVREQAFTVTSESRFPVIKERQVKTSFSGASTTRYSPSCGRK